MKKRHISIVFVILLLSSAALATDNQGLPPQPGDPGTGICFEHWVSVNGGNYQLWWVDGDQGNCLVWEHMYHSYN